MSNKKAVTIKDIAELANVSIGTVDRTIHNRGRVAPGVASKINKIIDELGYKPNMFASRLSRSKTFCFAVLMPRKNQDNKFWESSVKGIGKAEKELSHYHVRIEYFFYDRYSPDQLNAIFDTIFESNIDGILIAPILYKPIKEFLLKLPPHIPYVLFNTDMPDSKPLTFIGQDSFQSGFVCGKLMRMINHEPGTLASILTHSNDLHILMRAEGFRAFYKNEKQFPVKEYEIYGFKDTKNANMLMSRIFKENSDLRGIFVTNVSTFYLAEYLKNNIEDKKIFLIGYDLIDKNITYLKEGIIDFLISQKPEKQGYEGIYALYRHVVLGETCNNRITIPIDIITKENLSYYGNSHVINEKIP